MMSGERQEPTPCVTLALRSACSTCGGDIGRGRRYCSNACRQLAYRSRRDTPPVPTSSRRTATVYECPSCENRLLGEQRCPDCNVFARRVGPGGECPHCGAAVAVADLIDEGV